MLAWASKRTMIRVNYFRLRAIYAEAAAVIHAIEQLSNRAIEPSKQKSHCAEAPPDSDCLWSSFLFRF